MSEPITQSEVWSKLQQNLGETAIYRTGKGYHFLAIQMSTPVGNYFYCPYGPAATSKASFTEALDQLESLAREHHAIFVRIEPQNPSYTELLPRTAKKSKDLNPKDTWLLDLSPDQATLISNFSQGTRTRYNTYTKKGLVVESTKEPAEIGHLVTLQRKLYKAKNLHAFSEDYLKTELAQPFATLYLVKYHTPDTSSTAGNSTPTPPTAQSQPTLVDGQVLAASLFFDYDDTRYYMQSAADTEFKKLPATVALLTSAIFDAKEQGITYFDFWGIAPDGATPDHPWAGFTEFKKSFGGFPRHYAGTYDLVINPARYKLYQASRRVNRRLRHSH